MGIVIVHLRPPLQEELHDLKRRGLPDIVHVPLVGHPQKQYLRPLDGLPAPVQGFYRPLHHVIGHVGIYLSCQFDEAGGEVELSGPPGEVEGIYGDTVPSQTRAGVEGLKAEGFALCHLDHLPYVHPHPLAEHLHLVDQGDIDRPVDVLEQLRHLGHPGGGYRDHPLDHRPVERLANPEAALRHPPHHLGDLVKGVTLVSRVLPFWGVYEEVILSHLESRGLKPGEDLLLGGARVGGALEGYELSGAEVLGDRLGGLHHKGEVRFPVGAKGGGNADEDRVCLPQPREVGSGAKPPLPRLLHLFLRDVADVRGPFSEGPDLPRIGVKPQDPKAHFREPQGEGKAHISEPDHPHLRLTGTYPSEEFIPLHLSSRREVSPPAGSWPLQWPTDP